MPSFLHHYFMSPHHTTSKDKDVLTAGEDLLKKTKFQNMINNKYTDLSEIYAAHEYNSLSHTDIMNWIRY